MRKFFYGLGILTALVIVAGGLGIFLLARDGADLDRKSKAYVEDSVIAIARKWNPDELWTRAGPQLRTTLRQDDVRGLFEAAQNGLGGLVELVGSRGQAIIGVVNLQKQVSAKYVTRGRFQKGYADFQVLLVKQGDRWMIEGFYIGSPSLMRNLVGVRS